MHCRILEVERYDEVLMTLDTFESLYYSIGPTML